MMIDWKDKSKTAARRVVPAALLGLMVFSLSGCALIRAQVDAETAIVKASEELKLEATISKSEFRPGEAVVAKVTMTNLGEETIEVRDLAAQSAPPSSADGSVTFHFGPIDRQRRVQRFPVVSSKEEAQRGPRSIKTIKLEPGESKTREFLLTQLTEAPGQYIMQVHLDPYMDLQSRRTGKIYSEPIDYNVAGQPMFARDSKGLILLEDAKALASAQAPGPVTGTDALLVKDGNGFYKWWINVNTASGAGTRQTAYFIDPYFGKVWSEAKPFTESEKPASRVIYSYQAELRKKAEAKAQADGGSDELSAEILP